MKKNRPAALWLFLSLVLPSAPHLIGAEAEEVLFSPRTSSQAPAALRAAWRNGDWVASSGSLQALVAGMKRKPELRMTSDAPRAAGSVLAFVFPGSEAGNEINVGPPVVRLSNVNHYPPYHRGEIRPSPGGGSPSLEFESSFEGPAGERASIRTVCALLPGGAGIRLTSTITNAGAADITDMHYSLHVGSGTRYNFSPFHREKLPRLGYRLYHKRGHSLAWVTLHPPEEKDAPVPGVLPPGRSHTVDHALLVDREGERLLGRVFALLGFPTLEAKISVSSSRSRPIEFIVSDYLSSGTVYRDFLQDATELRVPLPEGAYAVRANCFPAVIEGRLIVSASGDSSCVLDDPPRGTVRVSIRDSGDRPLPGKVSFIGLHPTSSPTFEPENPRLTETGWESFKNSCYPPEAGQEVVLPVGVYLASASFGPEHTTDGRVIEILDGSSEEMEFRLERAVETPALLSIDPHLHTTFSDGKPNVEERLKSIVAEGVEAAVASDHNIIVDYEPALRALGLEDRVAVAPGVEVTSNRAGIHFNAFPTPANPGEENNGAPPFRDAAAAPLLHASREKFPGALLQLNHPRAGALGFFNNLSLDRDAAAWISDAATLDFDLLEVMNGPFFHASNSVAVEDWLHLINRGRFLPLAGSSDSHATDGEEPGYSRTYVLLRSPKASGWTWEDAVRALKEGRSFASNGPLLELTADGTATFGQTVRAANGRTEIRFAVRAAPWVDVSEVRLIVNGRRERVFPVRAADGRTERISETVVLEL
ncbi:MAG: PHP domain-containing protein, partial [Candidatus Aminicenantes bacterium]|nr:PHP domain-containing protein [Candidatus Aminicenantes bacterium]